MQSNFPPLIFVFVKQKELVRRGEKLRSILDDFQEVYTVEKVNCGGVVTMIDAKVLPHPLALQ